MKVYVAAKWEDRVAANRLMNRLIMAGHTITRNWTQCDQFSPEQAGNDMHGVMMADAFVFLAEKPLAYKGAYTEFGMALARGIPIYLLGHGADANIFTQLPQIHRTLDPLLERAYTGA